jgi:hypothetical protein
VTDTTTAPTGIGSPPPLGLAQRIVGVIFSPGETYRSIVAHPRVVGALAVVAVTVGLASFGFLSTEVGQNAMLDQQVRVMESFGFELPDDAYERIEAQAERARYFSLAGVLVTVPIGCAVAAGLILLVFNVAMGLDGTFKQAFALAAHSQILVALQQVFVVPLNYMRESMSSATNLGIFLPMLDETGFLARLLGAIDIFWMWWILNLAIGLAVMYKLRTAPIAWSLLAVYFILAVIYAAVRVAIAGA